jgi:hypothetical protein
MCDPVTVSVAIAASQVAISTASAAMEYSAQRSASNQQRDNEIDNLHSRDAAIQAQQEQVNEQASQQMSQRAVDTLRQRGHLAAAFADSGVGGNSQARAFNSVSSDETTDMATIEANRSTEIANGETQKRNSSTQASQQIQALKMPSLLGAGLRIASGTINAYGGYQQSTANTPKNKATG